MKLRIATCLTLPEPDPDVAPLEEALRAAGVAFEWLAWDDPRADWSSPRPTVLRSTWNYVHDRDGFLAWCERVAATGPFWNPPDVVRENTDKRYLLDLAARGVPVCPTALVPRGAAPAVASRGWDRVVVKPAIGAGSFGVRVFDAARFDEAEAHATALAARGDVLIQPYLASVDGHGERSVVWIDGEPSHEIRKAPRFAGDAESVTGPYPIAREERAVVEAAIAPWADRILYGRVDLARDDAGRPVVMELELAEPSLFFARGPGSAARFVAGLRRRLG